MKKLITLVLLMVGNFLFAAEKSKLWNDISNSSARSAGTQAINTTQCRHLQLNLQGMKQQLSNAPFEFTADARNRNTIIELPMPDGSYQRFSIVESPVCAPELAAKYPETRTWAGQGIDEPASAVRLDVTPWGFHAMILSPDGEIFIDPFNQHTAELYISYNKNDAIRSSGFECGFDEKDVDNKKQFEELKAIYNTHPHNANRSVGDELRKYRLALACTGEYADAVTTPPNTGVSFVHAAMVTSVNRVTFVYEHELSIRMVLIPNNDTLIFFTMGTPYTNSNGSTMLGQNQTTITNRIGAANYDIGHVFSTGGGGIAGLGVVCQSASKSRGVTGLGNPVGDAFDIDYVAHEMGHQFGGTHTFNSVTGSCGGGNRSANSAYEPGSGITIMAYAGICGADDLALHSIATFHTRSFDEISDYTIFASGSVCPVTTLTGNTAPVSGLTVYHYEVPVNTPFILTGAGSDPDPNDTVYFSWEQYDKTANGSGWNTPPAGTNSPLFMSYLPSLTPRRLFPKLANILANTDTKGEKKATYARLMNFRLTLRDNRSNGAGVTYDDTPVEVNVTGTVPFKITYPNALGVSWLGGSSQTVTWDVGATSVAPISSPNVNIYFSTSVSTVYPFPTLIAANVPNNGSYTFIVPNIGTTTGRILVEGAGNIFFDINDKNFTIVPVSVEEEINNESINISPNPSKDKIELKLSGNLRGKVEIKFTDAIGKLVSSKIINKKDAEHAEKMDISKLSNGVYMVSFVSEKGTSTKRFVKN